MRLAYQAYAGAHPGTVVVKFLHTVVTDSAVGAAGRPPVIAGGAPFGLNHKAIDLMLLKAWSCPTHHPFPISHVSFVCANLRVASGSTTSAVVSVRGGQAVELQLGACRCTWLML